MTIGLRLCGIADEPFCAPARNGSSTSRTSVRWRCRISVAKRSRPGAGQGDRRQQLRVAVARHDLGRDVLAREAEPLQHRLLDLGAVRGVGADRARERAHRHRLGRPLEPDAGCGAPRRRSRPASRRRSWARRARRACGPRRACPRARARGGSARSGSRPRRPRGSARPARAGARARCRARPRR